VVYATEALAAKDDGGTLLCRRVNISAARRRRKAGGRWVALSRGDCYSLPLHTSARTVEDETRAPARKVGRPGWLSEYVCLQGAFSNRLAEVDAISVLGMLTKWLHITRLVTRTKETIMFASIWVENPRAE